MSVEFHPLTVAAVEPLTDDAVAVSFDIPADLVPAFTHLPGQHIVIRSERDGEDLRRSYSICTPPIGAGAGRVHPNRLTVGIKRIPNGVFSGYATTELAPGDTLEVMAPIGEFSKTCDPAAANRYVGVAAGSGITPILSIVSTILDVEPGSEVTLIYGNRTTQSIMFLEELEALKNRYHDRFQVVHVLSREPHQVPLFQGRIDADKLRLLASSLIDVGSIDGWFLCGPLDMVETVTATLAELGVAEDRVHHELFFDERIETVPVADGDDADLVTLSVTIDGRTSVVKVDPAGPPLLDYARSVRAEVPFACKGGMCATCKAKVVEGEVAMTKNYALTAEEMDAGYVLTCQSHPVPAPDNREVHLSFDVHGGMGR